MHWKIVRVKNSIACTFYQVIVIIFKVLRRKIPRKWWQLDKIVYIKVFNFLWWNSIACVLYWRYVETLDQCYRSSNVISYWVSHRRTVPCQGTNPWHQTGSLTVSSSRLLMAAEPRKRWRQDDRI